MSKLTRARLAEVRARRGHWGEVVRADDPLRDRLSSPATRGHVAVAARYEGLGLAATRPQRKMRGFLH